MNPAEIVKKVLGEHVPNLHDWACDCGLPVQRIEHHNLPLPLFFDFDAHRAHVASEIVDALGLREVSTDHWCMPFCETDCNVRTSSYWRTESVATEREPLTDAEQAEIDGWFARFAKAQPATTPQAHVPAQERPNPANVGTGEGAGLEGAEAGA